METVYRKLSELKKLPNNPRQIKDKSFKSLCDSIKNNPEYFEARPIILSDRTGEFIIIAGNQRYEAAKKVGLKECPTFLLSGLTEAKEREIIIRDNVANGEWDFEILANEWDQGLLVEWGVPIPDGFGIKLEAQEDDFEIPDEIETDITTGDLIEIGEHRLLCGDSTDSDQVSQLMGGALADMIHTDPPYNVAYGENKHHPSWKIRKIENDKLSADKWEEFCKAVFSIFKLYNKGNIYMWGASGPEGMKMRLWLIELGCHWSATIIWKKDQLVLSPAKYQRLYEPCFYGWFDKSTFRADRKEVEVWEIDRPKKNKEHPTMKPIELCAKAINNSSKPRDIVLDLFLGSGSTMVASHQLNRKCYGMEIDPKYCQVIVDRMKKFDADIVIKKNGKVVKS